MVFVMIKLTHIQFISTKKRAVGVKVFDFDNTLYRGESSVEFSLFMIRSCTSIIKRMAIIANNVIKLALSSTKTIFRSFEKSRVLFRFIYLAIIPEYVPKETQKIISDKKAINNSK